jgi:hypothetical protein
LNYKFFFLPFKGTFTNFFTKMSETAVFYALVSAGPDGTLTPYKGASVDAVILPPTALVFSFRKAVWKKNPNSLAGIDAAQLKVFNAQSQSQEEDLPVTGLGRNTKECLFVLVPAHTPVFETNINTPQLSI